jgi:uncharacterized protein with PIN domain
MRLDPNCNPRRRKCPGCGSSRRPEVSPLARDADGRASLRRAGLTYWYCRDCGRHVWRVKNPRGFPAETGRSK